MGSIHSSGFWASVHEVQSAKRELQAQHPGCFEKPIDDYYMITVGARNLEVDQNPPVRISSPVVFPLGIIAGDEIFFANCQQDFGLKAAGFPILKTLDFLVYLVRTTAPVERGRVEDPPLSLLIS